ncbi:glycosyltransferase family 4 protein [Luteimonas sp. RC10]|uniref:glycosyltransferase family 4 protein n=1 Tax=Luteimonas sp. RC10 TaxID=2587035 RepID=UPI0016092F8F|nr:glycosyltransferase family 4 protein [Luteimonas sp. RC10]MBB3344863.1 glycosyltransferase involved in cell wall biosynthesis [Luteimonas sp. RC10]
MVNTLYPPFKVGGAERSVELLAQELCRKGMETHVITLHSGAHVEHQEVEGVRVHRLPLKNSYWPFSGASESAFQKLVWHLRDAENSEMRRCFSELIDQISPDVVHTNNLAGFSVSVWRECASRRLPVVHTARDYYLLHPNSKLFNGRGIQNEFSISARLWSYPKKLASTHVRAFVGISKYVVDIHRARGFFENASAEVIHNSVERIVGRSANTQRTGRIGFIGRLDESKGIESILEAMRSMPSRQLLVAGEGRSDYVAQLHRKSPSNVEFLGRRSPDDFFKEIDLLLVPSLWAEPLGRVVLEAYSFGVPVVAAKIGGLKDIVPQNCGRLFEPGAMTSIIDCIEDALVNIESLSQACTQFAHSFTSSKIADSYIKTYKKAIGEDNLKNSNEARIF